MPLTESITRGLVGIDDRLADLHPQQWDRNVFSRRMRVAPIHAMAMAAGTMKTPSRTWNWYEETQQERQGTVTDVYTDSGLSSAYASGGVAGTTLYAKMTEAHAKQLVAGDGIIIVDTANSVMRKADVLAVTLDGATSYATLRLLETDSGNALAQAALSFFIVSGGNSEGAGLRDPLFSEPTKFTNCYQRFDEAWEFTNDEMRELLRIDYKAWPRAAKQARDRLEKNIDRSFIFGSYSPGTYSGANGKPIYKTRGLKEAIETYEPNNVYDYTADDHAEISTEFNGVTWANGGIPWLEAIAEIQNRKRQADMLTVFTSGYALRMIQKAIRGLSGHSYEFSRRPNSYGLNVNQLDCPSGSLRFVEHPDFTQLSFLRKNALIVEKGMFKLREYEGLRMIGPKDKRDDEDGNDWTDSKKGGLMKKCGLSWNNLETFAWLKNIGEDNA